MGALDITAYLLEMLPVFEPLVPATTIVTAVQWVAGFAIGLPTIFDS